MELEVQGIRSPEGKGFSIGRVNRVLSVLVDNRVSHVSAVVRAAGVLRAHGLYIDFDLCLGPDSIAAFQAYDAWGNLSSRVLTLVCSAGVLSEAYVS
jgi:hypothetical protein